MQFVIKPVFVFIALIVAVTLAWLLYSWLYYINEVVEEGSAYGFTITSNKIEAVEDIRKLWETNSEIYVEIYDKEDSNRYLKFPVDNLDIEKLSSIDIWDITLDENAIADAIRLTFSEQKLIQIFRYRRNFENP